MPETYSFYRKAPDSEEVTAATHVKAGRYPEALAIYEEAIKRLKQNPEDTRKQQLENGLELSTVQFNYFNCRVELLKENFTLEALNSFNHDWNKEKTEINRYIALCNEVKTRQTGSDWYIDEGGISDTRYVRISENIVTGVQQLPEELKNSDIIYQKICASSSWNKALDILQADLQTREELFEAEKLLQAYEGIAEDLGTISKEENEQTRWQFARAYDKLGDSFTETNASIEDKLEGISYYEKALNNTFACEPSQEVIDQRALLVSSILLTYHNLCENESEEDIQKCNIFDDFQTFLANYTYSESELVTLLSIEYYKDYCEQQLPGYTSSHAERFHKLRSKALSSDIIIEDWMHTVTFEAPKHATPETMQLDSERSISCPSSPGSQGFFSTSPGSSSDRGKKRQREDDWVQEQQKKQRTDLDLGRAGAVTTVPVRVL